MELHRSDRICDFQLSYEFLRYVIAKRSDNLAFVLIAVSDIELANASKRLIITTERLIPNEEIEARPTLTRIPGYLVDAVCLAQYGAYPGTMPYEYFSDEDHLKEWLSVEKQPEQFKEFLDRYIFKCKDHEEYVMKNGGLKKMQALRAKELLLGEGDES